MCQDPELFDAREMTVLISFLNSTLQSLEASGFWITQNPGLESRVFSSSCFVLCSRLGFFFGAVRTPPLVLDLVDTMQGLVTKNEQDPVKSRFYIFPS